MALHGGLSFCKTQQVVGFDCAGIERLSVPQPNSCLLLADLPSEVQEQVWKLSQLAAEGLEKGQFIFDSIPCDDMGLMQSAEEELVIGRSVSYCFLHLTLQEYLAALHWSRMGSEDMVRLVSFVIVYSGCL